MGEAKQRGPRSARVAAAQQQAARAQQRPALACNACGQALAEVTPVDTTALRGIEQAYQAHCAACDQDTWAVRGDSAAVRAFYAALEKAAGQQVQLGKAAPRRPA